MNPPAGSRTSIEVLADGGAVARRAAAIFTASASEAIARSGRFTAALSGGTTPAGLYALLAEAGREIPWSRIHLFWGDERLVPPTHEESNYRLAREALLDRIDVPARNVHRIPVERGDAESAAAEYERALRAFFGPEPGRFPRFDLVLLGLGADGHMASLFPRSDVLRERSRLVAAVRREPPERDRVTLTAPVLRAASRVVFLVRGAEKAAAVREVLEGARDPERFPAQLVEPQEGDVLWLLDEAAAALLERRV